MQHLPSVRPTLPRGVVVLLLIVFLLLWFVPLGMRHLIPTDEGRYAEMAREMFVTGDWITPRYNGYKYFEKPPLQTWANALTFAAFGIGEWQARLYTALTGLLGIFLIGYTGTRLDGPAAGWSAALVMVASPYWTLMGHFNTLDMGLSFWMALTLCALLLSQRDDLSRGERRGWMMLSWAGMAFAMLSKGLIGILLPGAVLIVYMVVARDWRVFLRIHLLSGLLVFAAIVAPWFVLVQDRNPEFFHFFFIVQQFDRYLTPEQQRPGPFYYFIPVLAAGMLPWLSLLPAAVRLAVKEAASKAAGRSGTAPGPASVPAATSSAMPTTPAVAITGVSASPRFANGFAPRTMALVWAVFIFFFFSASHSKLPSYVLPVVPALALLLGPVLPSLSPQRWRWHLLGYLVFLLAAAIGVTFLRQDGSDITPQALYAAYGDWVWGAVACGAIGVGFAWWLSRRAMSGSILAFVAGWCVLVTLAGTAHEIFGRYSSGALLAPPVDAALAKVPADTPFYSFHKLDHTVPFYIGHTMIMVRDPDELAFGTSVEPNKWVPTDAAFVARWRSDVHAFALMSPDDYAMWRKEGLAMTIVAQDKRRVIVEKP